MLFETHCHLDYLKTYPMEETLKLARDTGVSKFMTISVEPNNLDKVIEIANSHDDIYCTQGVHPHDAKEITSSTLEKIKKQAKENDKVKAIGEIGLDYHYDNSPREVQVKMFEEQLEIACELDMPVVIHTREAEEDTIAILKNYSSKLKKKGVLHSFTSSQELAEFALNEGFFLGFNGIITFKKAQNVRDILAITPEDQLLFETDSPFLTPIPHRGKENGPFYLTHVADFIAKEKAVKDKQEFFKLVYENSCKLFNI